MEMFDLDMVVCEYFFGFVEMVVELGGLLVDVVEEIGGDILVDVIGVDVGGVYMGIGNMFVEFL